MAEELSIAYADDGIALAGYGRVWISVLTQPSTMPRLGQLRRCLERYFVKWPDGTFAITVLARTSILAATPADIREESTAIARDFPSRGSTIVVEGSGFTAAATRAFLTGIFLVSRNRSQIHANVGEGATWLAARVSSLTQQLLPAADLIDAVEQTRGAIQRQGKSAVS